MDETKLTVYIFWNRKMRKYTSLTKIDILFKYGSSIVSFDYYPFNW